MLAPVSKSGTELGGFTEALTLASWSLAGAKSQVGKILPGGGALERAEKGTGRVGSAN